jgi:hypothetical protein
MDLSKMLSALSKVPSGMAGDRRSNAPDGAGSNDHRQEGPNPDLLPLRSGMGGRAGLPGRIRRGAEHSLQVLASIRIVRLES